MSSAPYPDRIDSGANASLAGVLSKDSTPAAFAAHDTQFSKTLRNITREVGDHSRASSVAGDELHKSNQTTFAKWLTRGTKTSTYRIMVTTMTIFAIFSFDINLAFLPPSMDVTMIYLVAAVGALFGIDICINLITRKNYFLSFYFFLDIIGTLSIIPDILQLSELTVDNSDEMEDLQVARAGRAGRLARSAGTLRLARFAKFFRVVRLVRVVRIFRVMKRRGYEEEDATFRNKPSRIGIYLSDLITKRVIMIVIALIIFIPQLEYSAPKRTNLSKTMYTFARAYAQDPASFRRARIAETFAHLHLSNSVEYMQVADDYVVFDNGLKTAQLRPNEFEVYSSSDIGEEDITEADLDALTPPGMAMPLPSADTAVLPLANVSTWCEVDIRHEVRMQAIFQILLALLVICVFAMGSFAISHETNLVIVKPIERMTVILKKLAATVFALSMIEDDHASSGFDYDDIDDSDDSDDDEGDMETEMLEQIVHKMASIFDVDGGPEVSSSGRWGSKVAPMGAKADSYESTRSISAAQAGDDAAGADLADPSSMLVTLPNGSRECLVDHPELCSLQALLRTPRAAHELKVFMNQTLHIENFLFWQEVERFQVSCLRQAENIYKKYVSSRALSEINISDEIRNAVKNELYEGSPTSIRMCLFAEAQEEIFRLISRHAHAGFLRSQFVVRYIVKKKRRLKRGLAQ